MAKDKKGQSGEASIKPAELAVLDLAARKMLADSATSRELTYRLMETLAKPELRYQPTPLSKAQALMAERA